MNKDVNNLENSLTLLRKKLDSKTYILTNLTAKEARIRKEKDRVTGLYTSIGDYDGLLYDLVLELEAEYKKIKQEVEKIQKDRNKVQQEYDTIESKITTINNQVRRENEEVIRLKFKRKEQRERLNQRKELDKEKSEEQAKYQSIWLQIKQNYQSESFNELLQIHYPEYETMIAGGQEIDFLKAILKGQKIDQIQDISFFFADKIHLPYNERKLHSFIVASSGSGKSELIKYLIWQDFKQDTGLILIDPQGDLSDQVAKLKAKKNDKLVYFNINLDQAQTPIFNPLYLPKATPEEIERYARETVGILEELVGEDLTAPMRRLAFPLIYMLMMQGNKSLSDLIDYVSEENKNKVVEMAKKLPNPEVRKFFSEYFTNKQFDGTKISITSKVGDLLYESKFREAVTGRNTIDLEKYVNEGYKVIFNLSGLSDEATDIFGKLITTQIRILANKREYSTHRPSVFVYIDEFQRFTTKSINVGLTQLRKYGFHFTLATQGFGQGLDTETTKTVLSNSNIKIVGRNGSYDDLNKMTKYIDTDIDSLKRLKRGQFYIKIGSTSSQFVEVPSNLIDNTANMKPEQWAKVKAEQLEKYYTPKATATVNIIEQDEPQREQATGDQKDPLKEFNKPKGIKPLEMDI